MDLVEILEEFNYVLNRDYSGWKHQTIAHLIVAIITILKQDD